MNEKTSHINRMLEMQKLLKDVAEVSNNKKIEVLEIEEEKGSDIEEGVIEDLPTKYLSINQIKLSTKEVRATKSFSDRLKNEDSAYNEVQIEEKKAKRIIRGLARLSNGTMSVAPIICKGEECYFKNSCLTGDSIISGIKDKKIRDIVVGDIVYSFNLSKKVIEKDVVVNKVATLDKQVYLITTWYGNKLKLTEDHLVLTINSSLKTFKWMSIEEGLEVGANLIINDIDDVDEDLESIGDCFIDKVMSIKKLNKETVYDITIKKNHNFFANNINCHNCDFYNTGTNIIGAPCPVEENLLQYWAEKYKNEFKVDEDSITDLHAIGRLCTYDLYEMRLTKYLSETDQTLLVDFISSYDEDGNPISNKATSAAWDTIDKIDRMRSKTLKELMATREAKSKLIQTVANANVSNSISALKEKFERLVREHSIIEGEVSEIK